MVKPEADKPVLETEKVTREMLEAGAEVLRTVEPFGSDPGEADLLLVEEIYLAMHRMGLNPKRKFGI